MTAVYIAKVGTIWNEWVKESVSLTATPNYSI